MCGNAAGQIFDQICKINIHNFILSKVASQETPTVLRKGQLCLVFKPQKKGSSKKLTKKWYGPYRIVKRTNDEVYLLKHTVTNQHVKRHLTLIRLIPEEDESLTKVTFDQDASSVPGSILDADGGQTDGQNQDVEIELESDLPSDNKIEINQPIVLDEFVSPKGHDAPSAEKTDKIPPTAPELINPYPSDLNRQAVISSQPVSMDNAHNFDTEENESTNRRPQRNRKMPAYLDNFLLNFVNLSNDLNQFYPFKVKTD